MKTEDYNVGDIVYAPGNIAYYKDMQGTISNVHYHHSPDDVYYYRVENPNDRFNVLMPIDKIKLDIQSLRHDKLTELGIE